MSDAHDSNLVIVSGSDLMKEGEPQLWRDPDLSINARRLADEAGLVLTDEDELLSVVYLPERRNIKDSDLSSKPYGAVFSRDTVTPDGQNIR